MDPIVQLVTALLSWPACPLWLALMFRREIAALLLRLRSFKLKDFEGELEDPPLPPRSSRGARVPRLGR